MFQKTLWFSAMLLVVATGVVAPLPAQAQRYPGSPATGLAGSRGAYYGGSGYGGNYYGSPQTYMAPTYQYFYSSPLHSYSGYSPYYGYNPTYYPSRGYVGSGASYDSGDLSSWGGNRPDAYPYNNPALQPDLRDSGSYGPVAPYPYGGSMRDNALARPDPTAHITVKVPANAEVWFDGSQTNATGTMREYQSPPLAPGSRYTYDIRARWNENGREMTQTQRVQVTAGSRVSVDFPVAAKSRG